MKKQTRDLLDWYDHQARIMPWRVPPQSSREGKTADPYRIWLSEVMLQQTTVKAVKPYFEKFIAQWPTVVALAAAELDEVLSAWAGLGYYSRARNLKKCADAIVSEHDGQFPTTYDELKTLPGIGDYTASAIAAIAFNEAVPVVDGNVERVMTRKFAISDPLPVAKKIVKNNLIRFVPNERPGDFAQAMMDLGATICTPKRPACGLCPWNADCKARLLDNPENFPVKMPKKVKPTRFGNAYVILNDNEEIFLQKRPEKGLLAQMTEVPGSEWFKLEDGRETEIECPTHYHWTNKSIVTHTFTHFHLNLTVYLTSGKAAFNDKGWWQSISTLDDCALPSLMRKVIAAALDD